MADPVSDEAFRPFCLESLDSGGVSLLAKFSISEICARERPETGCVSAETSSNLAYWGLCAASTGCGGFLAVRSHSCRTCAQAIVFARRNAAKERRDQGG